MGQTKTFDPPWSTRRSSASSSDTQLIQQAIWYHHRDLRIFDSNRHLREVEGDGHRDVADLERKVAFYEHKLRFYAKRHGTYKKYVKYQRKLKLLQYYYYGHAPVPHSVANRKRPVSPIRIRKPGESD